MGLSKLQLAVIITTVVFLSSCSILWEFFWSDVVFAYSCDCKITTEEYRMNDSTFEWEYGEVVVWSGSALKAEKADEIRSECYKLAEEYNLNYSQTYNCECE